MLSSIAPGGLSVQGEYHAYSLPWIETSIPCQRSLTESGSYTSQTLPAGDEAFLTFLPALVPMFHQILATDLPGHLFLKRRGNPSTV